MDNENRPSLRTSYGWTATAEYWFTRKADFDARLGEIVCAWVRLKPGVEATEEEIKKFCKGQIAYYKIPEHVCFVTEFSSTLSGKIQKYKICEFEIEARVLQDVAKTATA